MEWKTYDAKVEGDKSLLQIDAIVSTEVRDRQGDILLADGLRESSGKVVVLLAHGMGATGMEPIAKVLELAKVRLNGKKGIRARIQFFPDSTGIRLYEKIRDAYMPNFSIGWIPHEFHYRTENDGQTSRVVSDWEILELSPVAVPSNPEAQYIEGSAKSWFKFLAVDEMVPIEYKSISASSGYTLEEEPKKLSIEIPDELFAKVARDMAKEFVRNLKGRVK